MLILLGCAEPSVGISILLVFFASLYYAIERLNRQTDNPFRAIIQAYERSKPDTELRG
ncbi:hypothetical protein OHB26_33765 [Nocardia sp. NBC_01503]|uniref:hypothetical protein n=1 Tax=Nocardia sp. NBC_01503 TaxID=2975997 RepID=UPI002E7C111E|nr:hypothetical protein [Nocardia sp. NBC_01503]WTL31815.1 hypothetical protein OHB26_33765 [Nocardia sp. NBC_01503]